MKLKKFDELNEASDPNDGGNQLPSVIKENIKKLVTDLREITKNYLSSKTQFPRFTNDGSNQWKLTIRVPLEAEYSDYILGYIEDSGDQYGVKIHVKKERRATMLEFSDGDSMFLIPIIMTMHGDDMIYHGNNKLEYGIWVNTYVAQKVR